MAQTITKKELNRKTVVAGFFFVFMQLLVRGVTFLITPFYTRLVSVSQYGEIRVYESWLLIIVPVLSLSLYRSVERAKYDFEEDFEKFVASVQTLSYLLTICCFMLISIFMRNAFMDFCGMDGLMYIFAIMYTVSHTGVNFFQRREKQLLRYKSSVTLTACMMLPAIILSVFLLYWGNISGRQNDLVDLRIIGYFTPQIIGGVLVAFIMWRQGGFKINTRYWKYAVVFSLPLIPETLSIQIMNQSDKIMVQKMVSSECAGIFTLATTVSFIIWIIENAVWDAWLPWLYEKISRSEIKDIQKPWDYIVYTFGFISWALVILAPEIILILGDAKYKEAVYLVAPMVTGTLFRFFSNSFTAVENYQKKTLYSAAGTMAAMLVNVLLNLIFIRYVGYQAAAYTTAFSYFILLVLQGIIEKRICGMRCVSMSRLVMLAILFFVLNVATMGLYRVDTHLRWIVFMAVSVLAVWKLWPSTKTLLEQFKKG